MANMISRFQGDLAMCLHNASAPSKAEWDEWMDGCGRIPANRVRVLVFTDGGGPSNAVYRKRWLEYCGANDPPIAVVNNNALTRGIITALGWFKRGIKPFAPINVRDAFHYVHLDDPDSQEAMRAAERAAGLISGGSPHAFLLARAALALQTSAQV